MPSERIQRRIDAFLDQAEAASDGGDWPAVAEKARAVLAIDASNEDAQAFLKMAAANTVRVTPAESTHTDEPQRSAEQPLPDSFAGGRYAVRSFLGAGASKKVYLGHDTRLERDVALAVVEGLDGDALERVRREARAVARLGDHANIVAVYDTIEEGDKLLTVYQYMGGGSLAELAAKGTVPFERVVSLGAQVCEALSFAHGKGVIHRDLKPANVFLSETGEAKLGDFGLASALDRTRLTEQGTFLGTAAYMAPEQALGQPADRRSDLYSLGCVLYELVTGRPPFVGDDTVAVVTQHLNTPPVSPGWHRAGVPPGLEALVLRLLEKDPAKRPQSAVEVGTLLASVDLRVSTPGTPSELGNRIPEIASDPLYRQTFVGREDELRQLQSALETALSGNGGLVMVVGEPGIGKTAVTEQLATYAAMRGARTLHGNCYEEGSLSLPYLPFIEAMRGYVLDRDPEALKSELGSNAPFVARIVSEVRDRLSVELPVAGDPEDDRWRLLQSVTGFLRSASAVQPLMLVLEDLHWSDRGTLDLLTHLARNLQGARLFVAGTYRDVEVDRSHPLSSALAELRRITSFTRIPLRGLSAADVRKMLTNLAGREVLWTIAEQVHRETEGNPLFVQEVVRYLVEEGLLARDDPGTAGRTATSLALHIPEGLRDVIGKRLSRLSPETNRLLAVAAVIGREFRLDVLQDVAGVAEEELYAALEEAAGKGVLEEHRQSGALGYRFTHAFLRQTLYEEIFTPRRIRTHQQVARAMERRYGARVDEHAAAVAEHFSQSTDAEDLAKAVHYGELAAQRAMAVYAYAEAARHLEAALEAQEVLDPDDLGKRCDLMVQLMRANLPAGEFVAVLDDVAPPAWELAERMGDDSRRGQVSRVAIAAAIPRWGANGYNNPQGEGWLRRATQFTPSEHPERLMVEFRSASQVLYSGDFAGGTRALDRVRNEALARGSSEVAYAAASGRVFAPNELTEMRSMLVEMDAVPRTGIGARTLAAYYTTIATHWQTLGDREQRNRCIDQLNELALLTRDTYAIGSARLLELHQALLGGHLALVADFPLDSFETPAHRLFASGIVRAALVLQGRSDQAASLWDSVGRAGQTEFFRPLVDAWLAMDAGCIVGTREMVDRLSSSLLSTASGLWPLCGLLQVATRLEDAGIEARAIELLEPAADVGMSYMTQQFEPVGLAIGRAEERLGRYDGARDHYGRGLVASRRIGNRPGYAISAYHLAKLLLEHFPAERPEAATLLDECIPEFRDMGMPVYLEDALRLKLRLQGIEDADPSSSIVAVNATVQRERPDVSRAAAPDGTVTLLFSDIENSTALNERLGDAAWMEVLRAHNALMEREVASHGGQVVKTMGDGYMVVFESARRALEAAVASQKALAASEPLGGIRVRMGMHAGEVLKEGDDFFGRHVNLAARVAASAAGGEILVSGVMRELVSGRSFVFDDLGERPMKGFEQPVRVFSVRWA